MNDIDIKSYFHLGFKIAMVVSLSSMVLFTAVLSLHIPFREAFQYAVITAFGVHFASYFSIRFYLKRRFEKLFTLLENLSNKQFEEIYSQQVKSSDELDALLMQTRKTMTNIEREIQRLNRLENYRKEFIGDISHELKTPIFAVQGFLETLLNGALEDKRVNRDFLQKAMRNVNRLTILTQDLMEISKLETGELPSDLQVLPIRTIILDVTESLQLKAEGDSIRLEVAAFDKSIRVFADKNQLKQVLINLIENAIKYNRSGGKVTVGVKPHPKNSSKILVYVSDTGLGMEEHDIPRVTERFFRIDKSRSREKGGTGLGLSIVKHIIESHHEQLFIESMVNVGTTFSFSLQIAEN